MATPRFDDLDMRIIGALAEDGRRPFIGGRRAQVAEATMRRSLAWRLDAMVRHRG
jgi:hypothetical protein